MDLAISCQIRWILREAATASHSRPFSRAAPDTLVLLRGPQQSQKKLLQDLESEPGNCSSKCCARGHLGYLWSLAREESSPSDSPQTFFSMSFSSSLLLMINIPATKCSRRKQLKLKKSKEIDEILASTWIIRCLCLVCHQIIKLKVWHI